MLTILSNIRRRPYLLFGSVAAVFTVVLLGSVALYQWSLMRELERIGAASEPITPDDLAAMYRLPLGAQDATDIWRIPIASIDRKVLGGNPKGIPLLDRELVPPPPGDDWPNREQVASFLVKQGTLMRQIDAAVATPGECCYLDRFDGGYQTLLSHVQVMREITGLLLLRAYVHAHAKEGDKALADVGAAIHAADTLKREPIMVTQLVRLARSQICVETLEVLLPRMQVTDAALADLQNRLSLVDFHSGLKLAVLGERAMGLTAYSDPSTAGAGKTPAPVYQAYIGENKVAYLRLTRQLVQAVSNDWPAPLQETAQYSAGEFDDLQKNAPWGGGAWAAPSGFVGPLRSLIEHAARETARVRAAVVGIAAVRFRNAEGRWPGSVAELIPGYLDAAPNDPFTSGPIILSSSVDGLRIYSVGLDGRDDGGVETPVTKNETTSRRGTPDVLFFLKN